MKLMQAVSVFALAAAASRPATAEQIVVHQIEYSNDSPANVAGVA
jgi:hypothetical protein